MYISCTYLPIFLFKLVKHRSDNSVQEAPKEAGPRDDEPDVSAHERRTRELIGRSASRDCSDDASRGTSSNTSDVESDEELDVSGDVIANL